MYTFFIITLLVNSVHSGQYLMDYVGILTPENNMVPSSKLWFWKWKSERVILQTSQFKLDVAKNRICLSAIELYPTGTACLILLLPPTPLFTSGKHLGPRLQTFFEHVSVLNSQSVLRNDVTSYCLARWVWDLYWVEFVFVFIVLAPCTVHFEAALPFNITL